MKFYEWDSEIIFGKFDFRCPTCLMDEAVFLDLPELPSMYKPSRMLFGTLHFMASHKP